MYSPKAANSASNDCRSANSLVLHRDRDDILCVKGDPCPVVATRRGTVGGMPLFRPAEVGSNPGGGGWSHTERPESPALPFGGGSLPLAMVSIGRAYLKVHGGPAPRRFDVLAGRREPWRRRRRRRPAARDLLLFLVSGGGGSFSTGHAYRVECSGGFGGGYITTSAA